MHKILGLLLLSSAAFGSGQWPISSSSGGAPTNNPVFTGSVTFGNYLMNPSEYSEGSHGTSYTINWAQGSAQSVTFTGSLTITMTNPQVGGAYILRCINNGTAYTITWPGTVKWPAGTAPTFTGTLNKVDLLNFYYDGTSYYGTSALNF